MTNKVLIPTFEREYLTREALKKTTNTVLHLMFNKLSDSSFGTHFLEDETSAVTELLLEADSCGVPLLIPAPVCPDYLKGGYVLGESIGDYARNLVKNIPRVGRFFQEHGFAVTFELDIADGDAEDEFLEPLLGIPKKEFLRRTKSTEEAVKREIEKQKIKSIEVGSLLARTKEMGVDYRLRQKELAEQILGLRLRRTDQALDSLVKLREGEFEELGIKKSQYLTAAAYELAGYSLYGELIGPDGLILITSPMAGVCVTAINFLKDNSAQFSPTLYLREKKERVTGLFLND
ncbi:hypothetical protein HY345_01365 [Candidatus Microgenomates bacterium]|nr:hypothetical protein [Candidatus Microgenomates bacterium]